ncbi:proline dehydrogenase family protein [bacterium]|nr:proline dehydrogenase family protein [bacterium]
MNGLLRPARRFLSRCMLPVVERAASSYVAGQTVADAMSVAERLQSRGRQFTVGYWDGLGDSPTRIVEEYIAGIRAIAGKPGTYLSIKVPSIQFSAELLRDVITEARERRVRIHFDSHSNEEATDTRTLCETFIDSGVELSYTLPGRWIRSIADAQWLIDCQLPVRVVKGQWPDTHQSERDLREGFLAVIDALAGKARHVDVASHDVTLVREAMRRLRAAGTSCQIELLYGLPMRESLALAEELKSPVRIYVPYGKAYLPYALSKLRNNPRIAWWMLRDFASSFLSAG